MHRFIKRFILDSTSQKLDKLYVSTALNAVFKATDFSLLLDMAKEKDKYKSDSMDIKNSSENVFSIANRVIIIEKNPMIFQ